MNGSRWLENMHTSVCVLHTKVLSGRTSACIRMRVYVCAMKLEILSAHTGLNSDKKRIIRCIFFRSPHIGNECSDVSNFCVCASICAHIDGISRFSCTAITEQQHEAQAFSILSFGSFIAYSLAELLLLDCHISSAFLSRPYIAPFERHIAGAHSFGICVRDAFASLVHKPNRLCANSAHTVALLHKNVKVCFPLCFA